MIVLNTKENSIQKKKKQTFLVKTNDFNELVYEKLKEAELEMNNTNKRYSKEDILKSMRNIIG